MITKPPIHMRQLTAEGRNILAMAYQGHRGTHNCYKKFTDIFEVKMFAMGSLQGCDCPSKCLDLNPLY